MSRSHLWYRKLPLRETGGFALLPLYVRGLAAMCLKLADDNGRIALGGREPWDAVARLGGATMGERRMLKRDIEALLEVGYLIKVDDAIVVTDLTGGGTSRARVENELRTNSERTENELDMNSERTRHELGTNSERTTNEPQTRTDLSARNHGARKTQGEDIREEKRIGDERREERVREDGGPGPLEVAGFSLTVQSGSQSGQDKSIDGVISHWMAAAYHPGKVKSTASRRVRVRRRLDEGYSAEDLKLAIDGAAFDDWLMGRDPKARREGWKDLETILRDGGQVERLRDLALSRRRIDPKSPEAAAAPPDAILPEVAAHIQSMATPDPESLKERIAAIGGRRSVARPRLPGPRPMVLEFDNAEETG